MHHSVALLRLVLFGYAGTYPVPIWEAARQAGMHVTFWPDMGRALGLAVMGDPPVVIVSEELDESERRYVLAHELGHMLCGHESLMSLCWTGNGSELGRWINRRQEAEADRAAALLLIPIQAIDRAEDEYEIAELCDVPVWLARLRLAG